MPQATNPNAPTPPDYLDGEALLEWQRVTAELDSKGLLDKTSRAMLTLYVLTWQVAQTCRYVNEEIGVVVEWPNGQPGISPYYKVWLEQSRQAGNFLEKLGLTAPKAVEKADSEELEI